MGTGASKNIQKTELKNCVIAAIDFGTVNTGLAIKVPENASIITRVFEESDRVPSMVLLDEKKQIKSFGRKAHNQFCSLTKQQQKNWYFFLCYKLQFMRSECFHGHSDVSAISGENINALCLLAEIFKNLQQLVYQRLFEAALGSISDRHVHWIITVPVIMSPHKREFMRKAAEMAGIPRDRLRLVLEPEAAAFSALQNLIRDKNTGFRYILVDSGGGTIDICVHEKLRDGKIEEILPRQGVICGGQLVNENYEKFLKNLVGKEVWKTFVLTHPAVYIEMLAKFEEQKKDFTIETHLISIRIEAALLNTLKEADSSLTLMELIKNSEYASHLEYDDVTNNLSVNRELMQHFFKETLDTITKTIDEVKNKCSKEKKDVQALILSGGLSESPYIRKKLENEFGKQLAILRELDPRNTVVRGAILIGEANQNVIERLAEYTYGFASTSVFNPSVHDEEASCMIGERKVCKIFNTIIRKGESLYHKKRFTKVSPKYTYADPSDGNLITEFYRSNLNSNPKFCHDCEYLAALVMKKPKQGWQVNLHLQYEVFVEDIELYVEVKNLASNLYEKTFLDIFCGQKNDSD